MDLLEKLPIYLLKLVLSRGESQVGQKAIQDIQSVFDVLEMNFKAK